MLLRVIRDVLSHWRRRAPEPALARIRKAIHSGNLEDARRRCDDALASLPDDVDVLHLAGVVALRQGERDRAIGFLSRAAHSPTDPQPALGLGQLLQDAGQLDEAIAQFRHAAQVDPGLYEAHISLGNALHKRGDLTGAEQALRKAIALRPESVEAHQLLVTLLYAQARHAEADATCAAIQRRRPADGREIFRALLIPAIYQSTQEIDETRENFANRIGRLIDGPPLSVENPVAEVGISPFYLAYHGRNDRELQQRIAGLIRKAYRPTRTIPLARRRRAGRTRIGLVSEHFNSHSVGRMNHGFVSDLKRDAFEVTVFSLRRHDDALARKIRADSDHFVEFDGRSLAEIEHAIAECEMDVLYFADIGMDPLTYFLAYSRLAPLQLVGWGHPDTTGIDTVDCFISSDAVEVADADAHYSERLVRLPCPVVPGYERPARPNPLKPRSAFGLNETAHVYACPQAPFKIHPDFDYAIAGILREDPRGEVVFVEGQHRNLTEMLRQRFRRTIADVATRIRVLPHMSWTDYLSFIAVSDVMLDPFHFGGGNTNYESLAMGVPVVTLPPRFLRGRFAMGCYSKMGMRECVAGTPDEYIALALRLGTDPEYRNAVSAKISERCEMLFGNYEMVRAFEDFLGTARDGARAGR